MPVVIDADQCMGCGTCAPFCPRHLLALGNERNARGVRHITLADPDACISCGRCEGMCPSHALRVPGRDRGFELLDKDAVPPHAGCSLGLLAHALAQAIHRLDLADRVVLFKNRASDVNMAVRSHDYDDDAYFDDALAYKRAHPEDVVVIIPSSSKAPSTAANEERYRALDGDNVTVINTLNWFEGNPAAGTVERGGSHIVEELAQAGSAAYLARGTIRSPQELERFTGYLEHALRAQLDGAGYSLVEFVFPCFYRVAGRPQQLMPATEIAQIYQWFDEYIAPDYPAGTYA